MSDLFELELAGELKAVSAPDNLWYRVQAASSVPRPTPRGRWRLLPMLATAVTTVAVAVATVVIWQVRTPLDLAGLAAQQLHSTTGLDYASKDAAAVRKWLRRETGLDVALPPVSPAQIEGARMLRKQGKTVGEIDYRVGTESATLLVSRADDARAVEKHGGPAWQSAGQTYALASTSSDLQGACVLCHPSL